MKYIVMNVVYKPNSSDYEFGIAEIISKFGMPPNFVTVVDCSW